MKSRDRFCVVGLCIALMLASAVGLGQDVPCIPDASGWGVMTPAGSGRNVSPATTAVYKVTNLNDNGPGSFRDAVMQTGPRMVVFETSGTITLSSSVTLGSAQSYLSIAGQTAPSPGITLAGNQFRMSGTTDVLIQHIRFRPGKDPAGLTHGIEMVQGTSNVVLDHVSVSWGNDENIAFQNDAHDVTIMNSISSEALLGHSKGLMVARSQRISIINTLITHADDRMPMFGKAQGSNVEGVFVNSMVYNWGGQGTIINSAIDPGNHKYVSVVGNVYKTGTNSGGQRGIEVQAASGQDMQVYLADNMINGNVPNDPWDGSVMQGDGTIHRVSSPTVWPQGLVAMPVDQVESYILANAGARPADRDEVDQRIINEVIQGTGSLISSQNEVGGWPVLVQNTQPLLIPADPNGDPDGDGYTNAEEWCYDYAVQVEGGSTSVSDNGKGPLADDFVLHQNYPNPFNPTTTIQYSLPRSGQVSLNLYDMLGRQVKTLVKQQQEAGLNSVRLDASNLPSGTYMYRLRAGDFVETKKLLLLK